MIYQEQTLEGVRFAGDEIIGTEFADCVFRACAFESVRLTDCAFHACRFEGCRILSPHAERTELKHCEFDNCQLVGVQWADFVSPGGIAAPFDSLKGCVLKYGAFAGMKLAKFDFSGCELLACMFDECGLAGAQFKSCRLDGTQFTGCDLRKADFRCAAGYCIDPAANRLSAARFSFPEVVRLLDGLGIQID